MCCAARVALRDTKMNIVHDDGHASNLDGSLSMCVSEDVVGSKNGQILKLDSGEGPFVDDLTEQQLPTALV